MPCTVSTSAEIDLGLQRKTSPCLKTFVPVPRHYLVSILKLFSFRMLKLTVFDSETSNFYLLARKSGNYEEAYINTLTK
ncbi:MAG: hypothetical protein EA399_16360 [Desulfovibrionales bacterium]|nr:MAG: hypothetical protein EA399_16360 [Desulfovibrionales bacterium]